jgi:DNA polymerase-3 subunit gamma/tau
MVSARKYRPAAFAEVVGQEHVTGTLRNALQRGNVAHAYLFTGPRGVGKTTCARILAKAVNCENLGETGDPCNRCDSCNSFNEGRSMSIFELDAASNNSVEDIRRLIESLRYVPQTGSKSVFIIDEVHMLSQAAFNAFLKTLEEPPAHALFILCTTEKHKILPTILSRCQKYDFRRIETSEIMRNLRDIAQKENYQYEENALHLIALKADGGMRDALSIFDQLVNFSGGQITYDQVLANLHMLDYEYFFRVLDTLRTQDHPASLRLLHEVMAAGFDLYQFMTGLLEHCRNVLMAQTGGTQALLDVPAELAERYARQAKELEPSLVLNAYQLVADLETRYRQTSHPRLQLELLLVKLAHLATAFDVAQGEKKKALTAPAAEPAQPPKTAPTVSRLAAPDAAPIAAENALVTPATAVPVSADPPTVPAPKAPVRPPTTQRLAGRANLATVTGLPGNLSLETLDAAARSRQAQEMPPPPPETLPPIEPETLLNALQSYISQLDDNQSGFARYLNDARKTPEPHRLVLTFPDPFQRTRIVEDIRTPMVEYLRSTCRHPALEVMLEVDESLEPETKVPTMNAEALLHKMESENENLRRLREIFRANIQL